jgi:Phage ABA sandwich domain
MESGRLLDKKIAEVVFGAKVTFLDQKFGWRIDYITDKEICHEPIFSDYGVEDHKLKNYSTDVKAAFSVIDHLRNTQRAFSLATVVDFSKGGKLEWIAKWEIHDPDYRFVFATGENVAAVICEASLRAMETKNDPK